MGIPSTRVIFAATALSVAASASWAAEYGTVVSSTPVVAAVPVPQQVCTDQPMVYQQPNSGAGALIGGLAGAAIGNSIGSGGGRAAATGIGLIAGSIIGDRVEADASPPVATTVRQCRTVTSYVNRTIGYDVVYEYQGMRRRTTLAQDPGDQIALNVSVMPAEAAPAPQPTEMPPPGQVVQQPPAQIYYPAPYYAYPYYPYASPVVRIGWGYGWGGGYGPGHGHRR